MLDSYENRFGSALAFGATVTRIVSTILNDVTGVLGPDVAAEVKLHPPWISGKLSEEFLVAICFYNRAIGLGGQELPQIRGNCLFSIKTPADKILL